MPPSIRGVLAEAARQGVIGITQGMVVAAPAGDQAVSIRQFGQLLHRLGRVFGLVEFHASQARGLELFQHRFYLFHTRWMGQHRHSADSKQELHGFQRG